MNSIRIREKDSEFNKNSRNKQWIENKFAKKRWIESEFVKKIGNSKWIRDIDSDVELNSRNKSELVVNPR